jgi:hypothetical protein
MLRPALLLGTGACVVAGQFLLASFSRSLGAPWSIPSLAAQAATSAYFWGAAIIYASGVGVYIVLLHKYPVVQVNLSLTILIVVLNIAVGSMIGQGLSLAQWIGALLAGAGIVLLHAA